MAARSKELVTRSLADLGARADAGRRRGRDHASSSDRRRRRARAATRVVREPAAEAAREVVAFLAERRII